MRQHIFKPVCQADNNIEFCVAMHGIELEKILPNFLGGSDG